MIFVSKLFLVLILTVFSETYSDPKEKKAEVILSSGKRILEFLNEHKLRINLDGIIGVRIYQGVLRTILANRNGDVTRDLANEIKRQDSLANSLSGVAIRIVEKKSPEYYKKLWPLIAENFWNGPFQTRSIDLQYLYKKSVTDETFDEKTGDDCFALLVGTSRKNPCIVSKTCWDIMTLENASFYSLTHQVFYFLIGIEAGCKKELETQSTKGESTGIILDRLCTNVWKESLELARKNNSDFSDIFMEQIGFCGFAGYSKSFSDPRWLNTILNWQRPNGCYGVLEDEHFNMENLNPNGYGTYRKKRAESLMSNDGCLAHKSTVALTALSTFLWNEIINVQE